MIALSAGAALFIILGLIAAAIIYVKVGHYISKRRRK